LGGAWVRLVDETRLHALAESLTADNGAFKLIAAAPGRYRLAVGRPSFLSTEYGALTDGGDGVPIALDVGERIAGLAIRLAPAAIISGVIEDASGSPASDIPVYAVPEHSEPSSSARTAVTDAKGAFRVTGLPPGKYTLVADSLLSTISMPLKGVSDLPSPTEALITAPVFYPGTSRPDEAAYIALSKGQIESDVRIRLGPTKPSRVTGSLSLPSGARRPVHVTIESLQLPTGIGAFTTRQSTLTSTDRFAFDDLAPGLYRITAATTVAGADVAASETATLEPEAPVNVALLLRLKPSLMGRIIAADGATRTYPAQLVVVRHMSPRINLADDQMLVTPRQRAATTASDGTFRIDNLEPGAYDFRLNGMAGAPPIFVVRSIQDDREVPPGTVDVHDDRDVEHLVIVVSRTPTIVTGRVLTGSMDDWRKVLIVGCSHTSPDSTVPAWTARVDNHGQFVFAGAAAGQYSLTGVFGLQAAIVPRELESRVCGSGIAITVKEGVTLTHDVANLFIVTP
jgi:hypothetical protein